VLSSVSWYSLLLVLPPRRIDGGTWMKARMPGTWARRGARSRAISAALRSRSLFGRKRSIMLP